MRILLAHRYDPSFPLGGAAQFVLQLAGALKDESEIEEVACLTNDGSLADKAERAGLTLYRIPWRRLQTPRILSGIRFALEDFHPNVFHSHHRYLTFLTDVFFRKKVHILHTEHVLRSDRRFLFRYGHFTNGVSSPVHRNLLETYHVPESRCKAIPNAVHLKAPDPGLLKSLGQGFPAKGIRLLCIGRLDEQKGHTFLIEAVARMPRDKRENLHIFLAGEGPRRAKLEGQVKTQGVQGSFSFLGHTEAIREYLELCDGLILPSLWEGMPLSVLEAFAAGKPVLATDIPGTRDIVEAEKTGWLVPSRDVDALSGSLIRLVHFPNKFRKMAAEVARRAPDFSFPAMIREYCRVYRQLTGEAL